MVDVNELIELGNEETVRVQQKRAEAEDNLKYRLANQDTVYGAAFNQIYPTLVKFLAGVKFTYFEVSPIIYENPEYNPIYPLLTLRYYYQDRLPNEVTAFEKRIREEAEQVLAAAEEEVDAINLLVTEQVDGTMTAAQASADKIVEDAQDKYDLAYGLWQTERNPVLKSLKYIDVLVEEENLKKAEIQAATVLKSTRKGLEDLETSQETRIPIIQEKAQKEHDALMEQIVFPNKGNHKNVKDVIININVENNTITVKGTDDVRNSSFRLDQIDAFLKSFVKDLIAISDGVSGR